jgi:hypothetical protein
VAVRLQEDADLSAAAATVVVEEVVAVALVTVVEEEELAAALVTVADEAAVVVAVETEAAAERREEVEAEVCEVQMRSATRHILTSYLIARGGAKVIVGKSSLHEAYGTKC